MPLLSARFLSGTTSTSRGRGLAPCADGVADLRAVALRELEEETGVMVAFFRMAAVFWSKASLLEGDGVLKVRTFRLNKTRRAKTVSRRVLNLSHEPISALTVATFFSLEVLTVNGHEARAYVARTCI